MFQERGVGSNVIVTGAAGFIGSHVCERLVRDGQRVWGVDNFCDLYDPALKHMNLQRLSGDDAFRLATLDIRDGGAVRALFDEARPAAVLHLAAMAGVRQSIEQAALYTEVNVGGTVNVLEAAAAVGVERFVFASSSSVYGNQAERPFAETNPIGEPISPYAATKRAGELLCYTWWHLHKMPMTCLRFFTVYGPRQRPDLAIRRFLSRIWLGEQIQVYGDGATSRDYTYIDDVVEAVATALARCERYRVYNIGSCTPIPLKQLIETAEQVVGKPALLEHRPMMPGDVDHTWADLTRSGAELGYAPSTRLQDGIASQWRWMRENGLEQ